LGTETDEITVREMVEAFAAYYPNPHPVTELLAALDLTEQQDRKVRQLSGGQRRRLDLALGMIGNPELLFLDEPTTGLDPEVRRRIWQFVTTLSERGMTIVLTTHYLEEAEQLADRVAVLVAGQIVTTGRPEEITGTTQSIVSFHPTGALATATLPDGLPATSLSKSNGRTVLTTADPTALVTTLVAWAAATPGGELQDLQIERRDLEQAYLDLLTNLDPKEVSA
jgi:ABC-2 type transport system ATP-binding protein